MGMMRCQDEGESERMSVRNLGHTLEALSHRPGHFNCVKKLLHSHDILTVHILDHLKVGKKVMTSSGIKYQKNAAILAIVRSPL